jgi:anti-sigma factor RsiW
MMLEKNLDDKSFEKKIIPYLDGSLSIEETSEFEAFISTHPEFEKKIKAK